MWELSQKKDDPVGSKSLTGTKPQLIENSRFWYLHSDSLISRKCEYRSTYFCAHSCSGSSVKAAQLLGVFSWQLYLFFFAVIREAKLLVLWCTFKDWKNCGWFSFWPWIPSYVLSLHVNAVCIPHAHISSVSLQQCFFVFVGSRDTENKLERLGDEVKQSHIPTDGSLWRYENRGVQWGRKQMRNRLMIKETKAMEEIESGHRVPRCWNSTSADLPGRAGSPEYGDLQAPVFQDKSGAAVVGSQGDPSLGNYKE